MSFIILYILCKQTLNIAPIVGPMHIMLTVTQHVAAYGPVRFKPIIGIDGIEGHST